MERIDIREVYLSHTLEMPTCVVVSDKESTFDECVYVMEQIVSVKIKWDCMYQMNLAWINGSSLSIRLLMEEPLMFHLDSQLLFIGLSGAKLKMRDFTCFNEYWMKDVAQEVRAPQTLFTWISFHEAACHREQDCKRPKYSGGGYDDHPRSMEKRQIQGSLTEGFCVNNARL